MDFSKFPNPYDFANPVSDQDLFFGRKEELEEITYYLDHALTAPRPINIALLGSRASGKTSLLNMCEIKARQRGFCTVRIDLDEDDAKSQLSFFYKLFDGLFSSVAELGGFGGTGGKTYSVYLDIMNSYVIPDDNIFTPFLFPLQFARAMRSGNNNVPISDHNYKKDLTLLRSEANRPVVLLFDECNILAKSRVHLEKIRNIFMNTPGFLLVFTGTPDLFPVMDEVFSPIVRQFKKINVGGFKDKDETEDCAKKPLEKIGIDPKEVFDQVTYEDVSEIHDISGGRPYEIQLICHHLFKRLQLNKDRRMKLDLSILEDVVRELETSQNIRYRPIISKVRSLTKRQLSAMNLFSVCDGCATFDQVWQIEYVLNGNRSWTKQNLDDELRYFVKNGILQVKGGMIKFRGDDFDKIYIKYYAREKKVRLDFPDFPAEIFFLFRIETFLAKLAKFEVVFRTTQPDFSLDIQAIIDGLNSEGYTKDSFVDNPGICEGLYKAFIENQSVKTITLFHLTAILPSLKTEFLYYLKNADDAKDSDKYLQIIRPLGQRASEIGGDVSVIEKKVEVISANILVSKAINTANERLRNRLISYHTAKMEDAYINKGSKEDALRHANLVYEYETKLDPSTCNNLGYIFMANNDIGRAKALFESAINNHKSSDDKVLPAYNVAILKLKFEDFPGALEAFDSCIQLAQQSTSKTQDIACLLVPNDTGEEIAIDEVRNPDLITTATKARQTLISFIERIKPQ